MQPTLRAIAAAQGGVFTRAQALMAGYSEAEIRILSSATGPWTLLRRGAYVESELLPRLDSRQGRLQLEDRAAHLHMQRPHLMSHDSAARIWRLPMLKPEEQLVHVTRFGVGGSRTKAGVKHHLTRLGLVDRTSIDTMEATGLARTALDLAREHGLATGVMACDAALRRGVPRTELQANLELMWSWPGVREARSALEFADPGAESPGESLLRIFVVELGIGTPVTQFPVVVGGRTYWADLRVGRHLFEFDGFTKFRRPELGGTAQRPADEIAWEEKTRQDGIVGEGLGMSRLVWRELFGSRRREARSRILREYAHTLSRFGEELPPRLVATAQALASQRLARLRAEWVEPSSTWLL